jgi:hypothetical protein
MNSIRITSKIFYLWNANGTSSSLLNPTQLSHSTPHWILAGQAPTPHTILTLDPTLLTGWSSNLTDVISRKLATSYHRNLLVNDVCTLLFCCALTLAVLLTHTGWRSNLVGYGDRRYRLWARTESLALLHHGGCWDANSRCEGWWLPPNATINQWGT